MSTEILVNIGQNETRVALVEGGALQEHFLHRAALDQRHARLVLADVDEDLAAHGFTPKRPSSSSVSCSGSPTTPE